MKYRVDINFNAWEHFYLDFESLIRACDCASDIAEHLSEENKNAKITVLLLREDNQDGCAGLKESDKTD